jgi:NTP pyrophosphatase (non-canonical NTP hydrolase)
MMGLAGEVGELANKVKKLMRGDDSTANEDILAECGDLLWYSAMLIDELGFNDFGDLPLKKFNKHKTLWVNKSDSETYIETWCAELFIRTGELFAEYRVLAIFPKLQNHRDIFIGMAGAVIHCVAKIAVNCDSSLEDVANRNIAKLESRQRRGKIQGNGDKR